VFTGCSITSRSKALEMHGSEAYFTVRRSEEG
jgi:hypothetical protein